MANIQSIENHPALASVTVTEKDVRSARKELYDVALEIGYSKKAAVKLARSGTGFLSALAKRAGRRHAKK